MDTLVVIVGFMVQVSGLAFATFTSETTEL